MFQPLHFHLLLMFLPVVYNFHPDILHIPLPEDCSFLSCPVGVASYLRPLVSDSDKRKMTGVSWQCLINEGMHAGNRVRFLAVLA